MGTGDGEGAGSSWCRGATACAGGYVGDGDDEVELGGGSFRRPFGSIGLAKGDAGAGRSAAGCNGRGAADSTSDMDGIADAGTMLTGFTLMMSGWTTSPVLSDRRWRCINLKGGATSYRPPRRVSKLSWGDANLD